MPGSAPLRCPTCRTIYAPTARFCSSCGRDLSAAGSGATDTLFAATELEAPRERRAGRIRLPPMRLEPGTMLSVYRVEAVIGEGGMGVVYKAYDEACGRAVAIKCLHTNLAGDQEIRRRFLREARVLRAWTHPSVVSIYDLIEHEHLLAIVMELIDGKSLVEQLATWRGRMPWDEIALLFGGVLEAMEDGHRSGVVHRDLKPDNILVYASDGGLRTKIVDFGISKILEGTSYTMSGAFLGTCRYMAPEQVKSPHTADFRADIYSLGVTLYQLCTGRVPFDDANHFALMMAHVNEPPVPPSTYRKDMPADLEELILHALAKDPTGRPSTCAAFRERLLASLAPMVPSVGVNAASSSQRPLPPSRKDTAGYEMLLVPAGTFLMGEARRPVHLDAFYMDRVPVTNEQFVRFMNVTAYKPEGALAARFLQHVRNGELSRQELRLPVVYVSWNDAKAYATWAGKRLPTEAEWEKAARGEDGRKYPWGRAEPSPRRANFGKSHKGPTSVGTFPDGASPYGILDLAGNVWEWCEDADDPSFYADGPTHNPRNVQASASDTSRHVMRGGSWIFGARSLRTYSRTSFDPEDRFASGGFRCAGSPY